MTTIRRQRRTLRWRVLDIVVASVLAAACAVLFIGWNAASEGPSALLKPLLPGLQGLAVGPWLIAGPLAGLVIRKPGAALYAEFVAAAIELLILPTYGPLTLLSGAVQGIGAELVFALLLYRSFGVPAALLAGAGAGLGEALVDLTVYLTGSSALFVTVYTVSCAVSGAIIGIVAWALVRAIATTGALDRFAAGRSARRVV